MVGIKRGDAEVKQPRKWRLLPPPKGRHGSFDGVYILDEIGGELGAFLFQRARDVLLWADVPPQFRDGLFQTRQPPRLPLGANEIAAELQVLAELVAFPTGATAERAATACAGIYHWALDRVFYATAAAFASAAAHAQPADPMFAIYAGRAERARGAYDLGTSWFQHAISVARQGGKLSAYTVALLSWANQEIGRGNRTRGRALLQRAWRYAKRHNLRHLGAEARHDLLALCIDVEDWEEAALHAEAAANLYGPKARNIFALAHDWALIWSHCGYFSHALPVMEAALPFLSLPSARVLALSSIARAAAVLGQLDRFRSASESVLGLAAVATENAPIALVHVAQASYTAGEVERARGLVVRAREMARGRQDTTAEHFANELFANIQSAAPPERDAALPYNSPIPAHAQMLLERIRRLAASL
jgi:tetratricopeptide (TPR) repeat protein